MYLNLKVGIGGTVANVARTNHVDTTANTRPMHGSYHRFGTLKKNDEFSKTLFIQIILITYLFNDVEAVLHAKNRFSKLKSFSGYIVVTLVI